MMHFLNVASLVAGLSFSVVGTLATSIGLVPQLRHKVVKNVAMSLEQGRLAARERD